MPTFKTFKDKRDGRIYNCVLMPDGKWWSAENLAWTGAGRDYNDDIAMRSIYGRLYTWDEAQTSIPSGTHLPTDAEFGDLKTTYIPSPQGTKLKANSYLWSTNTGTDDYGFAALPAGSYYSGSGYAWLGDQAYFWTSGSSDSENGYVYGFNSWSGSMPFGSSTKAFAYSVRFIVDTFPVEFPHKQITSVSNLQFQTANRQFKSESGSYRTLGSQGLPVLKGTLTYDLATSEEEALFDGWFSVEDPWTNDNFPGIGSVQIQAVSVPKKTHTTKGVSISLDVVIFPDANTTNFYFTSGPVPVMTPYAGVEAGFGSELNQSLVTTSGRSTARTLAANRGETFTVSWNTTLHSALVFLQWFIHISNGRKQFLGSLCGKVAWLWKIVGAPSMAITGDMVKISMVINGRDVNRALAVTIVKW